MLSRTQLNPRLLTYEQNCILCKKKFRENDIVSQLPCNHLHYTHTLCLIKWVEKEKYRCPFCAAPIPRLNYSSMDQSEDER